MLGAGLNGFGKLGYQPCLSCTGQLYAVAFVSGTNSPWASHWAAFATAGRFPHRSNQPTTTQTMGAVSV
jgi:hypothetical protein